MHRLVAILFSSLLLALVAEGCGGSTPSCGATFTPCGGSLEGTWVYQTACGTTAFQMMECPGVVVNVPPDVSGTWTFNADGTYSTDLAIEESGTETIPLSCLAGVTDCTKLNNSSNFAGLNVSLTACTGNANQTCTCTVAESGTLAESGKYATAGNNLSLTVNGSTNPGTPSGYCVSGNQLLLGDPGSTSTYVIFTKQ